MHFHRSSEYFILRVVENLKDVLELLLEAANQTLGASTIPPTEFER